MRRQPQSKQLVWSKRSYPDRRALKSHAKKLANILVKDTLRNAGIDMMVGARIAILDTCVLRTTLMLLNEFDKNIAEIVIVQICKEERDAAEANAIEDEINARGLGDRVKLVRDDINHYLATTRQKVDMAWIDFQKVRLENIQTFPCLASLRCLAVTIAGRDKGGLEVEQRVEIMTGEVADHLPHRTIDFGYSSDAKNGKEKGTPMQLVAWSRIHSPCIHSVKNATLIDGVGVRFEIGGRTDKGMVYFMPMDVWNACKSKYQARDPIIACDRADLEQMRIRYT